MSKLSKIPPLDYHRLDHAPSIIEVYRLEFPATLQFVLSPCERSRYSCNIQTRPEHQTNLLDDELVSHSRHVIVGHALRGPDSTGSGVVRQDVEYPSLVGVRDRQSLSCLTTKTERRRHIPAQSYDTKSSSEQTRSMQSGNTPEQLISQSRL